MKKLFLAILFSTSAFGQNLVETVDGIKGTGYFGLGDKSKITYVPVKAPQAELPAKFDWADTPGVLPEVRNQGSCGSCWAFAITGALESAQVIQKTGPMMDLSEQHMVSCDKYSYGCNGGFMSSADFVVRNGLTDEASFPYTARNSRCKSGLDVKAKAVKYFLIDKPNTTKIKTALIEHGPLFVTVMAGGSGWSGSTDKVTTCRKRGSTNHMVIITGYDEKGWIMRNSWGKKWGKGGYATVGYNCDLIGQEAGWVETK